MSSRIHEALTSLEEDVAGLALAGPRAIRARGDRRRRRNAAAATAAAVLVTGLAGTAALPLTGLGGGGNGGSALTSPTGTVSLATNQASGPTSSPSCDLTATPRQNPSPATSGQGRIARIFLTMGITPEERNAIDTKVRGLKTVSKVEFESQEAAWQRFARVFCSAPELVAATKPENLPESFIATLAKPSDFNTVRGAVENMPGVDEVVQLNQ